MTHMRKIIFPSPSHLKCRWISLSACCLKRKPPPIRDPSKRNFEGEKLEEYLRKRDEAIKQLQPYKDAVSAVIERFKVEVKQKEMEKVDVQGEVIQKERREREQRIQNIAIVTKNNEDQADQRVVWQRVREEEAKKKEDKQNEFIRLKTEKRKNQNTALVLQVIEESKNFITLENLDENIEAALDNFTNFNYAVTPLGEKLHSTKPPGNLDGWKGASPSAYIAGKIPVDSRKWTEAFKDKDTGYQVVRRPLSRDGLIMS